MTPDYLAQHIRKRCIIFILPHPYPLPLCSNPTFIPATDHHAHCILSSCAHRTHLNCQHFPTRLQRSSRTCGCQRHSPCSSTQLCRSSEAIARTSQPRRATGAISQTRRPYPASGAICQSQTRPAKLCSTCTTIGQTRSSGAIWRAPPSRRACAAP